MTDIVEVADGQLIEPPLTVEQRLAAHCAYAEKDFTNGDYFHLLAKDAAALIASQAKRIAELEERLAFAGPFVDERAKQIAKGYTDAHDDEHAKGEILAAALCYLRPHATWRPPTKPANYEAVADAARAGREWYETSTLKRVIDARRGPERLALGARSMAAEIRGGRPAPSDHDADGRVPPPRPRHPEGRDAVSKYHVMDGDQVRPVELMEWATAFERDRRRIALDEVGDMTVSTVFLGLDHNYGDGSPLLFETLVFGGPFGEEMDRYSTKAEAIAGHQKMVDRCRHAEGPHPMTDLKAAAEAALDCGQILETDPRNVLALYAERDEARNGALNLLAVIHRDGGHHTQGVGLRQSVEDAHTVWTALMTRAEAAEAAEASLASYKEEVERLRGAGRMMQRIGYINGPVGHGYYGPTKTVKVSVETADEWNRILAALDEALTKEPPRVNTDICVLNPDGVAAVTITKEPPHAE